MKIPYKNTIVMASIIVISISFMGCSFIFHEKEKPMKPPLIQPKETDYSTAIVKRGNIAISLSGICAAIPNTAANLRFQNSGGKLTYLNNEIGLKVNKGDIIAEIDAENEKYNLELATIDLNRLMERQSLLLEKIDEALKYDTLNAKIAVQEKKRTYFDYKNRLNPYDKDDELVLETAKLYYEKAESQYNELLNKSEEKNEDLRQINTDIQKKNIFVSKLEKAVEDSRLRSPINGKIMLRDEFRLKASNSISGGSYAIAGNIQESVYKIGDIISSDNIIATIFDTSSLTIVTNEDNKNLRENLKATVMINEKEYPVTMKSSNSTFENTEEPTNLFKYLLYFDKPAPKMQYGDRYHFNCITASRKNVLVIPLACIQQLKENNASVYVLDEKVKREVPIQVGLKTDTLIEVISGLKEGDEIVCVK